jgi:hypothetical protein
MVFGSQELDHPPPSPQHECANGIFLSNLLCVASISVPTIIRNGDLIE